MAKETKAQRLEREQALREAFEREMEATYTDRLMAVLERATRVSRFILVVVEGKFRLLDRNDSDTLHLGVTRDVMSEENMNTLTRKLEVYEAEEREAEWRASLRRAALSKLTKEEREELGL